MDCMYNLLKYTCRVLFSLIFRIKFYGTENIPIDGAYVVVSNHKSNFDPIIVSFITKRPIHFMAKAELFNTKFKKWIFESVKTIKVERGANDLSAIKNSLKVLKNGEILGLFPEGTRVKDNGEERAAKSGAVMLAHKSGVNILPISISASYKLFSTVSVRILPIFSVENLMNEGKTYEEISNILMDIIYEWSD